MNPGRPQVLAQKRFAEHALELAGRDLQGRFEYIFERNLWGSPDSRSGVGSTWPETAALRESIPALLRELGAGSLLDAPCGEFGWLGGADLAGVDYVGADIVPALVEANARRHGRPGRRFMHADLTADPLPRADLALCRDCLVHLRFDAIFKAIANFRRSGARWLLTTHFGELGENRDIEDGDWRPLNFELPPFRFPPPRRVLIENCSEEGGAYRDKSLALWAL